MKKLFKFVIYFIIVLITLLIVLLVVAKLSENKITDIALKKVSESIEAPVEIGDVSFNLVRAFPLATIELKNVRLSSPNNEVDSDSVSHDLNSIVNISRIYVSVKSKPLLNGEVEIMKVDIDGANMNYLIDSSGITNIDFLIASSDTTNVDTVSSDPLNITLTDFSAKNITCNYIDSSLNVKAKVFIPALKVKAELKGDDFLAVAKGSVHISDAGFEGINLHLMQKTEVNFDVSYENDSANIKQLDIKTDGADFNILGSIKLGNEIQTELYIAGNNLVLNELVKYAPEELLGELGLNVLGGDLNFKAQLDGVYSELEMPQVDLTIDFKNGRIAMRDYPAIKNIEFNGNVTNGVLRNNKSSQARFDSFHFESNQSKFDIAFSVLDIDNPKYDINATVDINVQEFKDFIPDSLIPYIDGNIKANLSTKGVVPDSIGDDFIDFVMANTYANIELIDFDVDLDSTLLIRDLSSKLTYKPNQINIDDLYISVPTYNANLKNSSLDVQFFGSINNTSDLGVDLKSYHIETEQSVFSGSAKVKNLDHPTYNFISKINLSLDEVKTMLPDSLLNVLKGDVLANIESEGTIDLDSIENDAMDIAFNSSSVELQLNNISVEMPNDSLYKIENLSGNIKMNPEAISIHKMKGVAVGLDFEIDSTEIWNTYKVLIQELDNEVVTVQTNIVLGDITNNLIGAFMGSETESQNQLTNNASKVEEDNLQTNSELSESKDSVETKSEPLLPDLQELGIPHFLVRGKLAINKLEYEKNVIDDISLKFRFADSLYVIEEFKLKTCGGEMNTSLLLNARGRFWEKPVVDIRSRIDKLNINELLILNDNFGDTSITYEKFAGLLTSELDARVTYIEGTFPTEKIRAEGHFTLEDGRIYGYEPLVDLSQNQLLGGLKGLDKLDFNTLNTSLFMLNDKIYIPKTDVVTSSMDITAFAMHSLKGDFEYHLKVYLGDVMTGKSNDLMKKQAKQDKIDGETFDRDGGLKLLSSEINGNKRNGLDNKKLREKFKSSLNKQQGWLRLFFNPFLVNFSTDLDRTIRNKEIIEKYGKKDK